MIETKSIFSDWNKSTPEQAYHYCKEIMKNITATNCVDEKIEIINKYHLRGITFQELKKQIETVKDLPDELTISRPSNLETDKQFDEYILAYLSLEYKFKYVSYKYDYDSRKIFIYDIKWEV